MENNDIDIKKRHLSFLDVCLSLQTVPKGLEIKKTPCIRVTDKTILED